MARASLDQHPDYVRMPVGTGQVKRGVSVAVMVVRVHAAREDGLDIFNLAVPFDITDGNRSQKNSVVKAWYFGFCLVSSTALSKVLTCR